MRDFHLPNRSLVTSSNGMCATSHPLATNVAIDILKSGGNAVDAAIAGAVLLGFCEPQSTGLGGDCFALIQLPNSETILSLNGSGRSPKGIDKERIRSRGMDTLDPYHPDAITIPGAVDAFCTLSNDYGKLGLKQILNPAIQYAEEGIPVAPRVSNDWIDGQETLQGKARDYFLLDGRNLYVGDMFRSPMQAEVLKRIAKNGRKAFYEGEVAEDMITTLRAYGGVHTLEDFADSRAEYTKFISSNYKGYEIIEQPPNGQGAIALLILNILNEFELETMNPIGVERTHLETEVTKLAMDTRNRYISDPDFFEHHEYFLDSDLASKLADLVKPDQVIQNVKQATTAVHKDTIYITVVDSNRMAVSLIYSIFHGFGSGIASDKFGILFHNRGAGFSLEKGHPNEIAPNKRPLHTIIPAMVRKDEKLLMSFGVMGGQYQAVGHARFLTNMIDYGMDIQQAIDYPRCFFENGMTLLENTFPKGTKIGLEDLGHRIAKPKNPLGGGQAIFIDSQKGVLYGGSDPRKDGCALGY